MHARCLQKPEENIESSWTWDTDDFELPCHCWKLNPRPLEELPVFFLSHQHKKKKGSSMTFCCCLVSMDPLHMIDLLNLRLFQRPICSLSKVTNTICCNSVCLYICFGSLKLREALDTSQASSFSFI